METKVEDVNSEIEARVYLVNAVMEITGARTPDEIEIATRHYNEAKDRFAGIYDNAGAGVCDIALANYIRDHENDILVDGVCRELENVAKQLMLEVRKDEIGI